MPGHTNGKERLFRYGSTVDLCGGFVGGPGGSRNRFCTKLRVDGRDDCGVEKHQGAKAELTVESYYIKMSRDSALVHPFVTLADLAAYNRMDITRESHTSRDWVEILYGFLSDNDLVILTPLAATSADSAPEDDPLRGNMFFADEDNRDQISELKGPPDADDVSVAVQSQSERSKHLKLSREAWNIFRPSVIATELSALHESEPWFKHVSALQGTAASVVESVCDVIDLLPETLQGLDDKMTRAFVSKDQWNTEAERVESQVSTLESLVFGTAMESTRSAFALRFGSVLESVTSLKDNVTAMKLDVSDLQSKFGEMDIDGRLHALSRKAAATVRAASDHALAHRIELEDRINDLDERMLAGASIGQTPDDLGDVFASALPSSRSQSRHGQTSVPKPPLAASGPLGEVDGDSISLDWLVKQINEAHATVAEQRREIDALKSSTYSKGVKVDNFAFEDINDILKLIINEDIDPDQFAGAVDAISLWVHFPSGNDATEKSTNELKAAKASGITDPTCCSLIASFRQKCPPYLLGDSGRPVSVGSRYPILHCRSAWEGKPALEGGKKSLLSDVKDAQATAKQYLQDYYPEGEFRRLCHALITRSHDWWIALTSYISEELLTLGQYGIPEEKVYTLVSDELQVMFRKMFTLRMKMQVFSASRDKHLYLAKAVWIAMQCHMVMDEFSELGFGTHVLISSMFTRFLAEQTGSNFASGVSKKLDDLQKEIASTNSKSESRDKAITTRLDKTANDIKALKTKCGVNPQG